MTNSWWLLETHGYFLFHRLVTLELKLPIETTILRATCVFVSWTTFLK